MRITWRQSRRRDAPLSDGGTHAHEVDVISRFPAIPRFLRMHAWRSRTPMQWLRQEQSAATIDALILVPSHRLSRLHGGWIGPNQVETETSKMLYTVLCYHDEATTSARTKEEDAAVIERLKDVNRKWAKNFKPIVRLMPTKAATTLRKSENTVIDGPYAETREQLLGFYIIDVESLDDALQIARDMAEANPGGAYELRPIALYYPSGEAIEDSPLS